MYSLILQQSELLPEGLNISFKVVPAFLVIAMMASFLIVGYIFAVADTDDMWVAGRSIGNIENGAAIGANWMSAASYLGMAALIALSGIYGLAFVVGWTAGYFVLLIFLAAQMRRFGKYTAPDFVGDRYNSDTARALGAITTFLIGFVYSIGQARGMGLVGLYVFGDITQPLGITWMSGYQAMMIVFMVVTIVYLTISGMLGATKNQVFQYGVLIFAFLAGLFVTGFVGGYSTILPHLEYGQLITELSAEFSEPFVNAPYYLWIATAFSLIFGTAGLPHVLVRFYTVENERIARWSTVWGLGFIAVLYLSAPAFAAFGTDLYSKNIGAVYGDPGMSSAAGDVIVVLATQLAGLPSWFVGIVAAGGIAAAVATVAGLFISASSAISHDIYTNLLKKDATQREQMIVARLALIFVGLLTMWAAYDPTAPIAALVSYAFALAAIVMFPMFMLGLWWENTNRQGALAGMTSGIILWLIPMFNEGAFGIFGWGIESLATWMPAIGSAIIGTPIVFIITIVVSMVTKEPPEETKMMVRQCHSPEPMPRGMTAEDMVEQKRSESTDD
ncbi:sodium:solute symporter family transporter [Halanaeroarchaeum sulfurireducens]|uniref:Sodium/solute symporter n=1 Tax=Halanaeroarchaeum sulfurireducens TaxID=1604004 RepID=A0A0F7P851_9EURY|nr:cation acetate symporter [Halanaeroarchaeum sulfurireducens]AKH96902.1 sodium/solute symporter [Halanaeroarchaeum sulfurireducens]ALG81304.1 sodium/solute symporter [Halanaeroarchaeum sulfurireducens]